MGTKIYELIMSGVEASFPEPAEPTGDKISTAQLEKYRIKLKSQVDRELKYEDNKGRTFRIMVGQCLPVMKNKLESVDECSDLERNSDVKGLMELMESLM